MKAGDFLKSLLDKVGFDTNKQSFIDALSKSEFANTELHSELVDAINTGLLTEQEAKSHVAIKSHYTKQVLDTIDMKIQGAVEKFQINPEDIADKSTFAKLDKLVDKLQEKANASGTSKGEKAELEKKINELNQQLSGSQKAMQDAVSAERNTWSEKFLRTQQDAILRSMPLPKALPDDVEIITARTLVDAEMQARKARVKEIDGKLVLVNAEDENLRIFEGGKELDYQTLTQATLSKNKFLKVSDTPPGGNPPAPPTPPAKGGQRTAADLSAFDDMIEAISG
jgi:hypothetical protein